MEVALLLSLEQSAADEKAQLGLAIEESARLAREEAEHRARTEPKPEATPKAAGGLPGEAEEESDEELPPLVLIPNSEE